LPQLSRRGRRILHATLSEIEPNGSDKAASRLSEPATPPKPPKPARPDKADEWAPLLTELKAHLASGLVSQTELAAAVEIGRTSLRDWLAGRRVPSPAARRKLRAWLAAHPLAATSPRGVRSSKQETSSSHCRSVLDWPS
jgi:hypothetical protein